MFQFSRFAFEYIVDYISNMSELPHSETSGSMLISNSPKYIAGNRVLLRF